VDTSVRCSHYPITHIFTYSDSSTDTLVTHLVFYLTFFPHIRICSGMITHVDIFKCVVNLRRRSSFRSFIYIYFEGVGGCEWVRESRCLEGVGEGVGVGVGVGGWVWVSGCTWVWVKVISFTHSPARNSE
jgi:hypothetical protein